MQREISDRLFLGETLNPYENVRRSTATASNYNDAKEKVQKIRDLIEIRKYDANLAKYIPRMLELAFQGMLEDIDTKEDIDTILLTENYYVNPEGIHICFPIKIKKKHNSAADIDDDMITVNNFFAHWVKQISITKYGSDKELPPTFTPWEICQYSDGMLKHLPSDALKTVAKTLLYDKTAVFYADAGLD